ncbi:MAG: hypothetical protein QMD65_02700 [Patescibacteria group bacterium]|nr:hypothetical protein [Patescibacteria group bacterium]
MGNILDNLGQLVLNYPSWSYLIIGAGILIQGELTILISMYLIASGNLTWTEFILSALPILVIGESLIYFFGRSIRHTRFGWRTYKRLKDNRKVQFYFFYLKKNLIKLLVASKFLIGTNLFLLTLIGWSRTKFGAFLKAYLSGVIIWFASMSLIAYFFMSGLNRLRSEKILHRIEIGVAIVIVLMFTGEYFFRKLLNKKLFAGVKPEEIKEIIEEERNPIL